MSFVLEKMETVMGEARSGFNYTTRAYQQASSAHPGFWDYVGDVVKGVQCYFRIRNARRALELPDHMLKDIGIGRAEIDAVTARPQAQSEPHRFEQLTLGTMSYRFLPRVNSASPSRPGASPSKNVGPPGRGRLG